MRPLSEMSTIQSGGIIYVAVCRVNLKAYVGQTRNRFKVRVGNHISVAGTGRDGTPFHKAMRKYGSEVFDYAVLESCHDISILDAAEQRWIEAIGSRCPHGYNRTDGGRGTVGLAYTDERREKVRRSQLGQNNRMKNPETAKKHGDAIRGVNHPYYGKSGPLHPRYGKHHKLSEETKARQTAAFNAPESKAARSLRAGAALRNARGIFIRRQNDAAII